VSSTWVSSESTERFVVLMQTTKQGAGPQRSRLPVPVQPGRLTQRLGVGRLWIELVSQTGQLTLAKKTGQSGSTPGIL
jgi:hypothetical protein